MTSGSEAIDRLAGFFAGFLAGDFFAATFFFAGTRFADFFAAGFFLDLATRISSPDVGGVRRRLSPNRHVP
jgi:hypothetical protein